MRGACGGCFNCVDVLLLITPREELVGKVYGNSSDDDVANYDYDLIFHKTNFRTHKDAYDQAAYDLLMKMTERHGKI